jgi:hypothetical protein
LLALSKCCILATTLQLVGLLLAQNPKPQYNQYMLTQTGV